MAMNEDMWELCQEVSMRAACIILSPMDTSTEQSQAQTERIESTLIYCIQIRCRLLVVD